MAGESSTPLDSVILTCNWIVMVQGYGATTFPALTEAIILDKNPALAAYEAQRLSELLLKLAERLS